MRYRSIALLPGYTCGTAPILDRSDRFKRIVAVAVMCLS